MAGIPFKQENKFGDATKILKLCLGWKMTEVVIDAAK